MHLSRLLSGPNLVPRSHSVLSAGDLGTRLVRAIIKSSVSLSPPLQIALKHFILEAYYIHIVWDRCLFVKLCIICTPLLKIFSKL